MIYKVNALRLAKFYEVALSNEECRVVAHSGMDLLRLDRSPILHSVQITLGDLPDKVSGAHPMFRRTLQYQAHRLMESGASWRRQSGRDRLYGWGSSHSSEPIDESRRRHAPVAYIFELQISQTKEPISME